MRRELEDALRRVGALLLQWRTEGRTQGTWEASQFKALADRMAHDELSAALLRLLPGMPVVSEEDGSAPEAAVADAYWLIDPIDGTASFAGGFDGFVTQAALVEGGEVVLAAVHAPARERMYAAAKGRGAALNGEMLKTVARVPMEALVDNYPDPRGVAEAAFRDLGLQRYVESGSIGLKICLVADGTADLFLKDVLVRDWDIAAPGLILEEAGGMLCGLDGARMRIRGRGCHEGLIAARVPSECRRAVEWFRTTWRGTTRR
jgi:3'(2'), 5'-bisphosphate nucleotidase/myo-inositol-1(or 4)-monophosphatase